MSHLAARASQLLPRVKDAAKRRPQTSTPPPPAAVPSEPRTSRGGTDSVDEGSASRQTGPDPLLTLLLTQHSFLDTMVSDGANALYSIETKNTKTTVKRTEMLRGADPMCTIRWCIDPLPIFRDISPSGINVQMGRSRPVTAEEFLKFVSVFTTRKFKIPEYKHSLKWKKVGDTFQLTSSGVRGTIAILDPSLAYAPPRIRIFHRLFDDHWDAPSYRGVPVILLDYILATSLLLAVDPDEWTRLNGGPSRTSTRHKSISPTSPISIQDWRQRTVVSEIPVDSFPSESAPNGRAGPSNDLLHPLRTSPLTDDQIQSASPSSGSTSDYPQTPRSTFSHPYSSSYGHSGSSQESSDDTMSFYQSLSGLSADELRSLSRSVSISASSAHDTTYSAPLPRHTTSTASTLTQRSASLGGRPRRSLPRPPGQPADIPPMPLVPPNLSHLIPPLPRAPPPQPPQMGAQGLPFAHGHARVPSDTRKVVEPLRLPPRKLADDRYNYNQRESYVPQSLPGPSGPAMLQPPPPPFRQHRHMLSSSSFDLQEAQARHALENMAIGQEGDRQQAYDLPPPSYDSINWAAHQNRQSGQRFVH